MKPTAVAILIIALGVGWLLTTQEILPGVNWIWVLGLAVTGLVILVFGGIDKATVVLGPFLLVASCMSVLRQTGHLSADTEAPILIITFGALLLLVQLLRLKTPKWLVEPPKNNR